MKNENDYKKRIQKHIANFLDAQDFADNLNLELFETTSKFYIFFHENGLRISKDQWLNLSQIERQALKRKGWIYSFYGPMEYPIYVGETGRSLIKRFTEHSKKKSWWSDWEVVKVLPCEDKTSRKYLEAALGIAGGYRKNEAQPPAREEILTLTLLGLVELKKILPSNSSLFHDLEKTSILSRIK